MEETFLLRARSVFKKQAGDNFSDDQHICRADPTGRIFFYNPAGIKSFDNSFCGAFLKSGGFNTPRYCLRGKTAHHTKRGHTPFGGRRIVCFARENVYSGRTKSCRKIFPGGPKRGPTRIDPRENCLGEM